MHAKPKPNPTLLDIIDTWMKKELPKAQYDVVEPLQTLMPRFKRITILKKVGKTTRPCFMVELHPSRNDKESVGYMVIKPDWSSILSEEATIKHDRVIWGKWNNGAEVMAADPEFFQKMTLYMTIAARVVTMGDFSPNLPPEDHNGLEL